MQGGLPGSWVRHQAPLASLEKIYPAVYRYDWNLLLRGGSFAAICFEIVFE